MCMKKNSRFILYGVAAVILLLLAFVVWNREMSKRTKAKDTKEVLDGATILMREDGFYPDTITVTKGTTVKFINKDTYWHWPASDPHPSHTFYSELDPKSPVKPDSTWSVTLDKVGKWGIHDHLAPYVTGTVTVTEK